MATWAEMRAIYPSLPASSAGWHEHENGGGWVEDGCTVGAECIVDADSYIRGRSEVRDSSIRDRSVVRGSRVRGSVVLDSSVLYSSVRDSEVSGSVVLDSSRVRDSSIRRSAVRDRSEVSDSVVRGSVVTARAILTGGAHSRSPIWIQGSSGSIGYSRPGWVASGSNNIQPLSWWLEHVEQWAEKGGYSAEEYRLHVECIAAWMRLYGCDKEESDKLTGDAR